MLTIRNLENEEEGLVDFQDLKRKRKVNGERTLSLAVLPTPNNAHSHNLIEEESSIFLGKEEYIIKNLGVRSFGNATVKRVEAVHKFYVDLIGTQQPTVHEGSITFNNYMNLVFEGTGYTFVSIDPFYARSFENLGNDNRLALLKKGLERFQAEMELVDTQVRFKQQVGNASDFQFRYGHNIKTIERDVDTTNLATVIRGKGDPELGIEAYYRSPNADIFGNIDAPMVDDERFKSEEALLEEMVDSLQDTPEFSITIDFADLRAAGYPFIVPNEGDSVFIIYEPMDNLELETRILEIEEVFDKDLKPIKTLVTLANYEKTFAGTLFGNTQKQLSGIVNKDGIIKYNALDEAVRIATEALQAAQTELIFENGIIARDKNNPNRLVVYNSEGLGISDDGGQTFREAITADGFVLSAGAIGKLSANHIQIGPETDFEPGYNPAKIKLDLDEFEEYVDIAFKDGIIEEAEAKAIEKYINILEAEKDSLTTQVEYVLGNAHAEPIFELFFDSAFDDEYMSSYSSLVQSINNAISDGKTTPAEKNNVDSKFRDYREKLKVVLSLLSEATDRISRNKVKEADDKIRDNLNLTAPLPTSIGMGSFGIKASTANSNKYAQLDYRGLYIAGGAIQIDDGLPDSQIENSSKWNKQGTYIDQYGIYTGVLTANQVNVGFNNISDSIKLSPVGLETYSGLERTSLIYGSGHRFYRDEAYVGQIGTSSWINRPSYRGLTFQMGGGASYMSWGESLGGIVVVKLVWHKDDSVGSKGFTFTDDVRISYPLTLVNGLILGTSGRAKMSSFSNAIMMEFGSNNRITLFDDGQVSFMSSGTNKHVFFPTGTKIGGTIEVDGNNLGMSPIDSPQILIEYIEFNVELSPFGTKIMLDETYLKTISSFAAFFNKGELVEKGIDFIVVKGEGLADIRFVGKRINYDDVFWGDTEAGMEVIANESTRELAETTAT